MGHRSYAHRYLGGMPTASVAGAAARLAPVRVRAVEMRLLAGTLTVLWAIVFGLVLVGYRPGGPIDLAVGLAAAPPALIAFAGILWPPVARGDRAFASIVWLGLGALLLLIPSIAGLVGQLQARGPQTLLPSVEAAYPWALALVGTAVFAGLGVARTRLGPTAMRRRRLVRGTVIGFAAAATAGSVFTTAALANELALRDRAIAGSRFGPTDPLAEPPTCGAPLAVGATSHVTASLDLEIDGRRTGALTLDGARTGPDVRWIGYVASERALGRVGMARIGDEAWSMAPGGDWRPASLDAATGADLDRQLLAVALTPAARAVAELHGIDVIEGARARHCRIAIDGTSFREADPEVSLLVGALDISRWRGQLDYWVFTDGQLGRVEGHVNGSAAELAENALQGTLRIRLNAVERGSPVSVARPRA
jgi:hypothetical protein